MTARATSLMERARELATLHELIDAAAKGDARLALVEGPAGIGKSRLLAELRGRERPASRFPRRSRSLALRALVAIAAVTAPTAAANKYPPLTDSLELTDLDTFDLYVTIACDKEVSATISGVLERMLVFDNDGVADHQIETFNGTIRWYTEDGKSYSSALENRTRIDFPDGVGYFKPAKITATAYHGGSPLLVGTNPPPGRGTLVYDGFIYAVDDEGFVYAAAEGDPISMSGNFARMTARICEALA